MGVTVNGAADFGRKVTCPISRNGDLIHRMYLQVTLPSVKAPDGHKFAWVRNVGEALIKTVEVEIGGQRIDKHYGDWLHIWNELTETAGHKAGYDQMIGNVPDVYDVRDGDLTDVSAKTVPERVLYIPLVFWFNRNPGLALPLIALQYHEVKVNIEFRDKTDLFVCVSKTTGQPAAGAVSPSLSKASLYVDYIYLDTDERRRFAQVSHEYLIEQLQFTGDEAISNANNKIKLNFNHPVKELIWVVQHDTVLNAGLVTDAQDNANALGLAYTGPQWFNYSTKIAIPKLVDLASGTGKVASLNEMGAVRLFEGANPVRMAKLQLNGHDRFAEREGSYFNLVQPYQHHENVPASKGINVYSFGLKPEEHQPSGTCNMSRIDTATLNLDINAVDLFSSSISAKVRIYACSYNVLRVMSGMGGLAYAN